MYNRITNPNYFSSFCYRNALKLTKDHIWPSFSKKFIFNMAKILEKWSYKAGALLSKTCCKKCSIVEVAIFNRSQQNRSCSVWGPQVNNKESLWQSLSVWFWTRLCCTQFWLEYKQRDSQTLSASVKHTVVHEHIYFGPTLGEKKINFLIRWIIGIHQINFRSILHDQSPFNHQYNLSQNPPKSANFALMNTVAVWCYIFSWRSTSIIKFF